MQNVAVSAYHMNRYHVHRTLGCAYLSVFFVPELCLFVYRALDLCKLVLSTFWLNRPHEASLPHFSVEI